MDFRVYGTAFSHKKGEFAPRLRFDIYFFGYFHTDYLYEANGEMHEGHAGDFMIVPPGEIVYHGSRPDAESGFVNDWMHVGGEDLTSLLQKFPLPFLTPIRTDARYLATAIERIHRERSYRAEGYKEKCNLILTDMLIDIYRTYKRSMEKRSEAQLEHIRGEIMHTYMRNWTLEEMARLAGYSPSRFSAVYKDTYGTTPIADLIFARIKNAKLLLRYSSMRISEIADAVGFSSLYYFSRHFKKLCGTSPSEYRESQSEQS